MSFVSDTLLSGGARLHIARGGQQGKDAGKQSTQTHGGRLDPLIRLVKDPFGILGATKVAEDDTRKVDSHDHEEHRKQVLYLRMRDVSFATPRLFHMLNTFVGRILRRMESRRDRIRYL